MHSARARAPLGKLTPHRSPCSVLHLRMSKCASLHASQAISDRRAGHAAGWLHACMRPARPCWLIRAYGAAQALSKLAPHIQQVDMESNGKGVDIQGRPLPFEAGEIDFGERSYRNLGYSRHACAFFSSPVARQHGPCAVARDPCGSIPCCLAAAWVVKVDAACMHGWQATVQEPLHMTGSPWHSWMQFALRLTGPARRHALRAMHRHAHQPKGCVEKARHSLATPRHAMLAAAPLWLLKVQPTGRPCMHACPGCMPGHRS